MKIEIKSNSENVKIYALYEGGQEVVELAHEFAKAWSGFAPLTVDFLDRTETWAGGVCTGTVFKKPKTKK